MYRLLDEHYDNVLPEVFQADLQEKDLVVLFYDKKSEVLQGFSTQRIFDYRDNGTVYRIIFSGDTINSPSAWVSPEFPLSIIAWMLSVWKENPSVPLLWMLICKGMRIYRLLPLYFRKFFPCCDYPTPPEVQRVMDGLGRLRYPTRYDRGKGLVLATPETCHLNESLAKVSPSRLKDKHVRFFCTRNADYAAGHELLCLARIEPENVRPVIMHKLQKRSVPEEIILG
jgi:hypothetical protein